MKTKQLIMCSIFAALSAVLSQLSIPIGPIPISMTHVSIFLAAGLLGAKYGAASQAVYALLGAVGAPVFTGLSGGFAIIAGPRGGFIIGYIACAFISGFMIERFGRSYKSLIVSMYSGWVITYLFGLSWFIFVTGTPLIESISLCVLPFLPGDALKTILCAALIIRLHPVLTKTIFSEK